MDDDYQDPLPEGSVVRRGDNLRPGTHHFVVMPDRSVRAFHFASNFRDGRLPGHMSLAGGGPVFMAGTFDVDDGEMLLTLTIVPGITVRAGR